MAEVAPVIAVDTNVLLRTLVDDEDAPQQCEQARRIVGRAGGVRIHAAVLLETAWLLARAYRLPRSELATLLSAVCGHPKMQIDNAPHWLAAIALYRDSNLDLADALILLDARERGITLQTFDKTLGKQSGAQRPS
ncbi:PIN domain-containing protein [Hydrocarboniphaga sp.]|uniref:PIN domain-containing protein n=1 Tax=Hydrocarboniphaga sp. TaxID=2033016 RepID=UPI003D0A50D5